MAWWGPDRNGSVVVAVADGHGSRKSFRSRMGAQLAVAVGMTIGRTMVTAGIDATPDFVAASKKIVEHWLTAVRGHLATMPLLEAELAGVEEEEGWPARQTVEAEPVLAYGATLMLAVLSQSFAVFLQLGDGDILVVSPSGRTSRPMPEDSRLLGNETTSLCMREAERQFRCASQSLATDEVAVLMLATDGLGNAYRDEASLMQVGSDLVKRLAGDGADAVSGELESYLREASQHSGDDATLVVVWLGTNGAAGLGSSGDLRLPWGEPATRPPVSP